jgi:hypothetical protein
MAADEQFSDDWGDEVARWTMIVTVVLAVLYVGSVLMFVLLR